MLSSSQASSSVTRQPIKLWKRDGYKALGRQQSEAMDWGRSQHA